MVRLSVSFQGQSIILHRVGASVTVRWSMNFIDPFPTFFPTITFFCIFLSMRIPETWRDRENRHELSIPFDVKSFFSPKERQKNNLGPTDQWAPNLKLFPTFSFEFVSSFLVAQLTQVVSFDCRFLSVILPDVWKIHLIVIIPGKELYVDYLPGKMTKTTTDR